MTSAPNRTDIVPGVMHCAKCKFEITRITLAVNIGAAIAGDNQTEHCPNGCGPLWPVTWEQAARKAWDVSEQLVVRAIAAERSLAELRSRLGVKVAASGDAEPSAPVRAMADRVYVPTEATVALCAFLTGYGPGKTERDLDYMTERDRAVIMERGRARWVRILEIAASGVPAAAAGGQR
jgi:hypothetical protein